MSSRRVLVVEDDSTVRRLCADVLDTEGYEVWEAERGEEALALAEGLPFDLALLDYNLPGADGVQVFQHLRRRFPNIVGILMSADLPERLAQEVNRWGLFGFLPKPFDLEELVGLVSKALRRV